MLLLHLLLIVLSALTVVSWFGRSQVSRILFRIGSLSSLTAMLVQLMLVGVLWQLVPAYTVIALTSILMAIRYCFPESEGAGDNKLRRPWLARFMVLIILLLLPGASALMLNLFPLFSLPEPDGPHRVGTRVFYLEDQSRTEMYADDPEMSRQIRIRTWYPAAAPTTENSFYWQHGDSMSRELAKVVGLPPFIFSHLGKIRTNAYVDAEILESAEPFPVVLFSHGAVVGYAEQSSSLMESLASHGYVTISIDHSYTGLYVEFPDGRIASNDNFLQIYSQASNELDGDDVTEQEVRIKNAQNLNVTLDAAREITQLTPLATKMYADVIDYWKADQEFVVRSVLNQIDFFANQLDPQSIGIAGMSMGGFTAFHSLYANPRFRAGVNLDGYNLLSIDHPPLQKPMLYLVSDDFFLPSAMHRLVVDKLQHTPGYVFKIPSANHFNFSDIGFFANWLYSQGGQLGDIDPVLMSRIVNTSVLSFFDTHLKGETSDALANLGSRFPEIEVVY